MHLKQLSLHDDIVQLFVIHNPCKIHEYFYRLILPIMILIVITEVPIVMFYTCKNLPDSKVCYRLLFFACCHTIWFIHRLAADFIIAMLIFITSPSQTITAVTVYLTLISATIITIRSMFGNCSEYSTIKVQLSKDHCTRCSSLLLPFCICECIK